MRFHGCKYNKIYRKLNKNTKKTYSQYVQITCKKVQNSLFQADLYTRRNKKYIRTHACTDTYLILWQIHFVVESPKTNQENQKQFQYKRT